MATPPNGLHLPTPESTARIHRRLIEAGVLDPTALAWRLEENERIRKEAGQTVEKKDTIAQTDRTLEIVELLAKVRFNPQAAPPAPTPLYSLAGNVIATAENLMVVQAKMKAGKSAAIGAMIASTMEPRGDCLWFTSGNPNRGAVLHFDTEQSGFDHYNLITRSIRRAGHQKPPPWFYSYHVKGNSIATIKALILAAFELALAECGSIHSVIIDGIADLCADVNDAGEANALVAEMEALAMKYKTLIVCVLHENHASDSGKTRGHLGSQLARKAETNLRLEKNQEGTTIMFADTSRSVHITKKNAPGFAWSDEEMCHVSVMTTVGAIKAAKEKEDLQAIANQVFEIKPAGVIHSVLCDSIALVKGISPRTAERWVPKMMNHGIIFKSDERYLPITTRNPQ